MAHWKTYFPTRFIDETDLPKERTSPPICKVAFEDLQIPGSGSKEPKLIIYFEGDGKSLVCNKTNAHTIAKLWGNDRDQWIGKKLAIYFDPSVRFGAEVVGGVRVRAKKVK